MRKTMHIYTMNISQTKNDTLISFRKIWNSVEETVIWMDIMMAYPKI